MKAKLRVKMLRELDDEYPAGCDWAVTELDGGSLRVDWTSNGFDYSRVYAKGEWLGWTRVPA